MAVKHISSSADVAELSEQAQNVGQNRATLLRRVLKGNAAFSALSGLLCLFVSKPIANLLGFSDPAVMGYILALGIGLIFWAMLAFWVSTRPTLSRGAVFTIIEGDLLWVAASIVLLMSGWLSFSTAGYWVVAIVADVVALFAILQYVGWRRLTKG